MAVVEYRSVFWLAVIVIHGLVTIIYTNGKTERDLPLSLSLPPPKHLSLTCHTVSPSERAHWEQGHLVTETARARYVVWARLFCREVMLRAAQKCYNKSSSTQEKGRTNGKMSPKRRRQWHLFCRSSQQQKLVKRGRHLCHPFMTIPSLTSFLNGCIEMVSAKQEARWHTVFRFYHI